MNPSVNYRPNPTGNRLTDEALRIAFDYIYQLRNTTSTHTTTETVKTITQSTITAILASSAPPAVPPIIQFGPFETRLPVVAEGTVYIETSRSSIAGESPLVSYVFASGIWNLLGGMVYRSQAQIATLQATLTSLDVGLRVFVGTPYMHTLLWSGAAWAWAPEDDLRAGEGPILREVDPQPLDGWQLYDGNATTYLKYDGSTGSVTLPNLVANNNAFAYLVGGNNTGGVIAANPPTQASSTLTTANNTTGITASGPFNTGASAPGTSFPTGVVNAVTVGGTTSVATAAHTHVVNSHSHTVADPTISDPGHNHSLSGSITLNADGQPQHLIRRPWFRR